MSTPQVTDISTPASRRDAARAKREAAKAAAQATHAPVTLAYNGTVVPWDDNVPHTTVKFKETRTESAPADPWGDEPQAAGQVLGSLYPRVAALRAAGAKAQPTRVEATFTFYFDK